MVNSLDVLNKEFSLFHYLCVMGYTKTRLPTQHVDAVRTLFSLVVLP